MIPVVLKSPFGPVEEVQLRRQVWKASILTCVFLLLGFAVTGRGVDFFLADLKDTLLAPALFILPWLLYFPLVGPWPRWKAVTGPIFSVALLGLQIYSIRTSAEQLFSWADSGPHAVIAFGSHPRLERLFEKAYFWAPLWMPIVIIGTALTKNVVFKNGQSRLSLFYVIACSSAFQAVIYLPSAWVRMQWEGSAQIVFLGVAFISICLIAVPYYFSVQMRRVMVGRGLFEQRIAAMRHPPNPDAKVLARACASLAHTTVSICIFGMYVAGLYGSSQWKLRAIRQAFVYKILEENALAGFGAIHFSTAPPSRTWFSDLFVTPREGGPIRAYYNYYRSLPEIDQLPYFKVSWQVVQPQPWTIGVLQPLKVSFYATVEEEGVDSPWVSVVRVLDPRSPAVKSLPLEELLLQDGYPADGATVTPNLTALFPSFRKDEWALRRKMAEVPGASVDLPLLPLLFVSLVGAGAGLVFLADRARQLLRCSESHIREQSWLMMECTWTPARITALAWRWSVVVLPWLLLISCVCDLALGASADGSMGSGKRDLGIFLTVAVPFAVLWLVSCEAWSALARLRAIYRATESSLQASFGSREEALHLEV